jgi:hypothetical protein
MKKIFLGILIVVALVFLSDRIYKFYSRSNVNSHETIILINNQLQSNEVDTFFSLEEGTFNPAEHKVVFSLIKKDGDLLDNYINLPFKQNNGQTSNVGFECNIDYEKVRPYNLYDYEIGNRNIIARIIGKNTSAIKKLNSNKVVAQKNLGGNYQFGKLNILDVNKNGIQKHCN